MAAPAPAKPPESSICSKKFREMLQCVESHSTPACTKRINDFLACERAVFHAALRKYPNQNPQTSSEAAKNEPPKQPAFTRTAGKVSAEDDEGGRERGGWAVLDILQRSVKKEADACIDVFESFKKSGVGDVWRFGLRMVVDGVVSCRVVGSRAAEGLRKGWESIVDRGGSGDEGG